LNVTVTLWPVTPGLKVVCPSAMLIGRFTFVYSRIVFPTTEIGNLPPFPAENPSWPLVSKSVVTVIVLPSKV